MGKWLTIPGVVAAATMAAAIVLSQIPIAASENETPKVDPAQFDLTNLDQFGGDKVFARVCAVCHGEDGQGNRELNSPSIAGMPAYYLLAQLEKFREGKRGTDPKHAAGLQMRAIALAIEPEVGEKLARHIQGMKQFPTVSALGGDPKKGKIEYAERCMSCHRFNGKGELVFGSPPLIHLQDWYLLEQLQRYRNNLRGAAKGDEAGLKMIQAADKLSDETLKDIIAYIGELAAGREPKGSVWK